jgi:cell division protein FtsI/penicillin-binding protein 2/cell division protein FtsW (lipid II flippase)
MLTVERGLIRRRGRPARPVELSHARADLVAVGAAATLVLLGQLNLRALGAASLATHQAVAVAAGALIFVGLRSVRTHALRWLGWACYGTSLCLLLVVAAVGDLGYGARRWLTLGSFTVQPSELGKIGVLLVLAQVLTADHSWPRRLLAALAVAAPPIGLVVLEPDLSTAAVLTTLTVAMLVLGRVPLRYVGGLAIAVAVVAPIGEHLLRPYQLERLHAYLHGSGSSGAGWTIMQAHIAVAWGGRDGRVGEPLHQLLAQYLPARETDLAFASLVEQYGIRAGVLAVLAAAVLVWRIAASSRYATTRTAGLCAAGLAALLGIEVAVSVAANLGLVPTAGVPFPLVSFGGTAAAVHLAAIGLVLGLRADGQRHQLWVAPSWRRRHPRLLRATVAGVTATLVGMLAFAWHLQRAQGPALRTAGLQQMTRCVRLPAPRGQITDRHGVPLTVNVPQDEIWLVRGMATPNGIDRLARLVGQPASAITAIANESNELLVKVTALPPDVAARIAHARLPGVLVEPAPQRRYPYGALLGPILGWTGVATPEDMKRWPDLPLGAIVGRAGIEQQYDAILRGQDGTQCVYVDPAGHAVALASARSPVAGHTLQLSIDLGLQRRLDADLASAVGAGGQQGAAVMLDPRTGAVLAMASRPSYDDNVFGPPVDDAALSALDRQAGNPTLEHATQDAAPPGSTFKLVVASADLMHRTIPPDEVIATGAAWSLGGHTFHNWTDLPPQDLEQAIAWSNDVYFYQLAWQLGPAAIIDVARQFGVGRPTGIDLPGESAGFLGTPSTVARIGATWYPGSTVLLGIGQGYLAVTPLQDARWTAGVATGRLVTPHLAMSYRSGSGSATPWDWPAPTRLPFARELGPVRAGMRAVVTSGTALLLGTLPYDVGAKTGTAEDPGAGGEGLDSWLTAAAPMSGPRVVVTAFVRGQGNGHPSTEVARSALAYFFSHERMILSTAR